MSKYIDLIGKRFGRLKVIEQAESNKQHATCWKCLCDCGNYHIVSTGNLNKGNVRSCGCLHIELSKERNTTHGKTKTRIYRTWINMISRCEDVNHKSYKHYGGRGIYVCKSWRNNFQNFYDWAMLNGYADNLTIDRKNNNGNYDPDNCTWNTSKEQCNNRSNNRIVELNGNVHTLAEWSNITGINYQTLRWRLNEGWEPNRILGR